MERTEAQPWSPEEKQRLLDLTLKPSVSDRVRLTALVVHFKSNGTLEGATHVGERPPSKALAKKVRGFVEDGQLDWLVEARSGVRGRGLSVDFEHLTNLTALAATLSSQVAGPDVLEPVAGSGKTRREVFSQLSPGDCAWYLGHDAAGPVIPIEDDPGFPYLREHLEHDGLWREIQQVRNGIRETVAARVAARSKIKGEAEQLLGPTLRRLDQEGGGITEQFTSTIYRWGIRTALGAALPPVPYMFNSQIPVLSDRPAWQPKNHPLRFPGSDGEVIAAYPTPMFPRDAWKEESAKYTIPHANLLDAFAKGTARELLALHRKLDEIVRLVQTRLAPLALRQLLASSSCRLCD